MYLIEILVPLRTRRGARVEARHFDNLRRRLIDEFGGLTAFVRMPAEGLWQNERKDVERDEIVIVEVMADRLDAWWWAALRAELEETLEQEEIVIRAVAMERL